MALILPLSVVVSLFVSVFVPLIGPIPVRAMTVSLNYPIKVKGADPLWRIKRKGLWGFMDRAGQVVIKPRFTQVTDFVGGLASACVPAPARSRKSPDENVRCGYINHAGEFVIPPRFKGGNHFQDGVAVVQMNDGATLIDTQGEILTTNRFFYVEEFSEGLACVKIARNGDNGSEDSQNDLLSGYIDTSGRVVVAPIYENAEPFQAESLDVHSVESPREGLPKFTNYTENHEIWSGFLDLSGNVRVPARYWFVESFSEGRAAVSGKGSDSWGYVDTSGTLVIPMRLGSAQEFVDGLALVFLEDAWCYIDLHGRVVARDIWDSH